MPNEPVAPKPPRPTTGKDYYMGRNEKTTKGQKVIPTRTPQQPAMLTPPAQPKVAGEFAKWADEKGLLEKKGGFGTVAKVMGGAALGAGGLLGVSHAIGTKKRIKAEKPFKSYMQKTPVRQMLKPGKGGMGAAMTKYRRAAFE